MDPTINLINPNLTELVELSTPFSTESTNLKWNIVMADVKQVNNLPPEYLTNPEDFVFLQESKKKLGDHPRNQVQTARDKANPYEGIGKSIFMNRAGIKIANIDRYYDISRHVMDYFAYTTPHLFKFVDLAGAPGAFTQYIQWRRPEAMGYGMSLKDGIGWQLDYLDESRFLAYYGEDGSGDLYTQADSLIDKVKSNQVDGVDLVVADGGFDVEESSDQERQEFLTSRLILVEIYTALQVLREGGDMIVKMFSTVTQISAHLLWIAANAFDQISLFKPISSRPANAEVYLIGKRKRRNTSVLAKLLYEANRSYNQDETVIGLVESLPDDFVTWLTMINDHLTLSQQQAVDKILAILNKEDVEIPRLNLHKALIHFQVPGNVPKIPIIGTKDAIPFSPGRSIKSSLIL